MGTGMKRILITSVLFLGVSSPLMADMTVKVFDSYGSSGGGEYLVSSMGFSFTPVGLGEAPGKFESFCVEKDESIGFNTTYYVTVNTYADNGGVNTNLTDPLDKRTAYLYSQFLKGDLDGYTYSVSSGTTLRTRSANALQNVIWYLEGEISDKYSGFSSGAWYTSNGKTRTLIDQFLADANAWQLANPSATIGNVRILNLWGNSSHTYRKQDILVMMPPPTTQIPSPTAATLGLLGMASVVRRRRRSVEA